MPSPVTPSSIQSTVPSASGSACGKFQSVFVTLPTLISDWFTYVFNEDGTFTTAFQLDLCAINCTQVNANPGPGPTGSPLAATSLVLSAVAGGITLTWNAIPGAVDYDISRNTINDLTGSTFIGTTTNLTFTDTTATNLNYYIYWIQGRTPTSSGIFSAPFPAWRNDGGGSLALAAPTPAATTAGGSPSVTVTWSRIAGAASYDVFRNTSNTNVGATALGNSTVDYFNDYTAVPGTSYYYLVTAKNQTTSTPTPNGSGVIGSR